MSHTVSISIPIVCETHYCRNYGTPINRVSGLPAAHAEAFLEDYDGSEPEDRCPLCGKVGIAYDPEPEQTRSPSAGHGPGRVAGGRSR